MPSSVTTTVRRPARPAAQRPRATVRTTTVTNTPARTRPSRASRRARRNNGGRSLVGRPQLQCYLDSLADPWINPGCKIGFGTMSHTDLATFVYRGVVTAAADGSLAVNMAPSGTALIQ